MLQNESFCNTIQISLCSVVWDRQPRCSFCLMLWVTLLQDLIQAHLNLVTEMILTVFTDSIVSMVH